MISNISTVVANGRAVPLPQSPGFPLPPALVSERYPSVLSPVQSMLVAAEMHYQSPISTVNSPCYSHRLGKSLALGHIRPDIVDGTILALKGGDIETVATVVAMPIYDPAKSRTHA